MRFLVLLAALASCAQKPAAKAVAPPDASLAVVKVDARGAVEACLSGAKPAGALLLLRVELWRGKQVLGSIDVPDNDPRARFAVCRPIPRASPGDVVRVAAAGPGPRPHSVVLQLRPDGVSD